LQIAHLTKHIARLTFGVTVVQRPGRRPIATRTNQAISATTIYPDQSSDGFGIHSPSALLDRYSFTPTVMIAIAPIRKTVNTGFANDSISAQLNVCGRFEDESIERSSCPSNENLRRLAASVRYRAPGPPGETDSKAQGRFPNPPQRPQLRALRNEGTRKLGV